MIEEFFEWIKITLKYRGRCIVCDDFINADEQALWMQNVGIKHIECPVDTTPPKDNSALVIIDEDDKKLLGIP